MVAGRWGTTAASAAGPVAAAARPRSPARPTHHLPTSPSAAAEFFSPPYLFMGPRPKLINAPDDIFPGDVVVAKYASAAPVTKALLIRAGASTHSMQFGERRGANRVFVSWARWAARRTARGAGPVPRLLRAARCSPAPRRCSPLPPAPCPCHPADARALWLNVKANNGQEIHLETPPSSNLLPPGLYMLVLNTAQGVPSNGHLLSIRSKLTAKAAKAAKH